MKGWGDAHPFIFSGVIFQETFDQLLKAEKDKLLFQKFHQIFNLHKTLHVSPGQKTGSDILRQLGIQTGSPVIVFNGISNGISNEGGSQRAYESSHHFKQMIQEGVGRAAGDLRASVIDGGTDSGMLSLLNAAFRVLRHPGFYIGVAPAGLTYLPSHPSQLNPDHLTALGDAHTHFVLVEGDYWGVEIPTMYTLISALADRAPYLRISIENGKAREYGGKNFSGDASGVLEPNGQPADRISLQLRYAGVAENPSTEKLVREEVFSVVEMELEPEKLASKIKYFLKVYSVARRNS